MRRITAEVRFGIVFALKDTIPKFEQWLDERHEQEDSISTEHAEVEVQVDANAEAGENREENEEGEGEKAEENVNVKAEEGENGENAKGHVAEEKGEGENEDGENEGTGDDDAKESQVSEASEASEVTEASDTDASERSDMDYYDDWIDSIATRYGLEVTDLNIRQPFTEKRLMVTAAKPHSQTVMVVDGLSPAMPFALPTNTELDRDNVECMLRELGIASPQECPISGLLVQY